MNLALTAYAPNFKDPRVRRRIASVLDWCSLHLSTTSPEPVHHDNLRAVFGTATNVLTKFLRANLLIQVGTYVVGKQSLSYLLNERGYDKLRAASQHMVTTSAMPLEAQFPELSSLTFDYKFQSDRYWHPLQNIKREHKQDLWRDRLPFNYDIEACAPTVLFQCARRAGLPALLLSALQLYLDDRSSFRVHVSELTGMSLADSKQLINSLFNGARLSANHRCSAFRRMNCDVAAMRRLRGDRKTRSLVRNIANIWSRLQLVERQKQIPSAQDFFDGKAKPFEKRLKTPKQKWAFYFAHERKILDAITDELRRDGIRHFTEHDGFRTESKIDVSQVEAVVLQKTGFKIKLSEEIPTNQQATRHMVTTSFSEE